MGWGAGGLMRGGRQARTASAPATAARGGMQAAGAHRPLALFCGHSRALAAPLRPTHLTVPSPEAEYSSWLSGVKSSPNTGPEWPVQ